MRTTFGRCQSQAIVTVCDIRVNHHLRSDELSLETYVDIRFLTLYVLTKSGRGIYIVTVSKLQKTPRKTIPTTIGNEF